MLIFLCIAKEFIAAWKELHPDDVITYRAGEIWSIYAIPAISLCTSSGTMSFLIKRQTNSMSDLEKRISLFVDNENEDCEQEFIGVLLNENLYEIVDIFWDLFNSHIHQPHR